MGALTSATCKPLYKKKTTCCHLHVHVQFTNVTVYCTQKNPHFCSCTRTMNILCTGRVHVVVQKAFLISPCCLLGYADLRWPLADGTTTAMFRRVRWAVPIVCMPTLWRTLFCSTVFVLNLSTPCFTLQKVREVLIFQDQTPKGRPVYTVSFTHARRVNTNP